MSIGASNVAMLGAQKRERKAWLSPEVDALRR
jgi:hypothetical protein